MHANPCKRGSINWAIVMWKQRNSIFADMHANFRKIRFAKLCHRDVELEEHNVYHFVFEQIPLLLQKTSLTTTKTNNVAIHVSSEVCRS